MAWRKLSNPDANAGNNTLVVLDDWGSCCESATETAMCIISSHNLSTTPIDTITIDGVDYDFAAANTGLLLEAGINAAMEEAGYLDVDNYGTLVSGANTAAYIRITSTATITKLITTGDSNVNFTCA